MASAFNLTAQINLRGPTNLKPIVSEIKRSLGSITSTVDLKIDTRAAKNIDDITSKLKVMNRVLAEAKTNARSLSQSFRDLSSSLSTVKSSTSSVSSGVTSTAQSVQKVAQNINVARTEMEEFGKQSALAIRRFAAFSVVTGAVFALTNAITNGFKAFVQFDRELVKLQQVTGQGAIGIKSLENEITRLATSLGVSSESLMSVASTLAQAGLTADETRIALAALAKTELAPSFDNLTDTTEGAIAALRQFGLAATDLEAALGSINAVAAAFAVESRDIIVAIQRTGGVFASASKGVSEGKDALNEFIAVFTSVRATTRESAETIATGLRTIFTRIQRAGTIKQLREFGVELQDLEGKFVGPFEAIKRLSEALNRLDPRDIRFSTIVEELGGFRQIGKVIPLIQQFQTAQQALGVAQRGSSSLTDAQIKAQQSLAVQLAKVREQFLALIRDIGQSTVFNSLFKIVLGLTSGFLSLAGAFKPILPILAVFTAIKGVSAIGQFATGFFGGIKKGGGAGGAGKNIGETISGAKEKERSAATARAADAIVQNTKAITSLTTAVQSLEAAIGRGGSTLSGGGKVLGFNRGGVVPGSGKGDKVPALLEPGEVVMSNNAANKYGRGNLVRMNKYASGGEIFKKQIPGALKGMKDTKPITYDDITKLKINNSGKGSIRGYFFENFVNKEFGVDAPENKFPDIPNLNVKKGLKEKLGLTKSQTGRDFKAAELKYRSGIKPDFDSQYTPENTAVLYAIDKNNGGKIQKFMAGSRGGIDWKSLSQGRGKEGARGARDIIEPISSETYLKWAKGIYDEYDADPSLVMAIGAGGERVPPEIALANKLLTQYAFETGGAGLAVGKRFVRTPKERISDELRPYLVPDPSDPNEFGFFEDDIRKFGRAKVLSKAATAKLGRQSALEAVGARMEAYTNAESAISSFKESGVLDVDPSIMGYLIQSIRNPDNLPLESKELDKLKKKLTKPNLDAFNALVGPDKIPVGVQGQRTKLSEVFGKILETYGSDTSDLEIDNIIRGIGSKIQDKRFGGIIQKFMEGSVGGVMEQTEEALPSDLAGLIKEIEKIGGTTQLYDFVPKSEIESILKEKKVFPRPTAKQLVSSPWLTAKTPDLYGDRDKYIEPLKEVVKRARSRFNTKQSGIQAQLLRNVQAASGQGYKFGLASIYGPQGQLGYSSTSDAKEIKGPDGTKYLTQIIRKSLPENFLGAVRATSEDIAGVPARAAERFQYAKIFDPGGPLAFDFDETLVKGSDIPGKNPADYSDLNKVQEALKNAELTLLGKELQRRIKQYPELLDGIRVLTARPQSNAPYLASTLSRLGLPISESKITGVSGGLNKVDNLSELETLIDDNLENVQSVMAGGKRAIPYSEPRQSDTSSRSIQVMEGYALEEMVKSLGVNISSDDANPLRPIDYPNGLGVYASDWNLPPNIPTDTKRTNSSSAVNRLFDEAERFYAANFALGGPVDLYHGSNTGVEDAVLKSFKEKGALSNIAQGYGQGAGFYVYTEKDRAKQQAEMRVRGGGGFTLVSGDTAGRPMVLTFQEMLDPDTWDLDYELQKGLVVKWMHENFAKIKDIVAPTAGIAGISDIVNEDRDKGIMSGGIRVSSARGTRKTIYSGTSGDIGEGEIIGQLMTRLKAGDPKLVHDFESQLFQRPLGLVLKYVGATPLVPKNIETFAAGGLAGKKSLPSVNQVGSDLAEKMGLVKGPNAYNQTKDNCFAIAIEVAKKLGYEADADKISAQIDNFVKLRAGSKLGYGFVPSKESLAKSPGIKRLLEDPTSIASTGNILVRESEELMKHASFETMGKEYNFGAAGADWPIRVRIPLKKKKQEGLFDGGLINKFSSGGTVPAMVSKGEAFVPPKLAKKIGYAKLDKMNQADRNGMKGFAGGGVSVFSGPGSGTSDSIGPVSLPVGSYIIRKKATDALGLHKNGSSKQYRSGGYVGKIKRFVDGGPIISQQVGNIINQEFMYLSEELDGFVSQITSGKASFDSVISGLEKLANSVSPAADEAKALADRLKEDRDFITGKTDAPNQAPGLMDSAGRPVNTDKSRAQAYDKAREAETKRVFQATPIEGRLSKEERKKRKEAFLASQRGGLSREEARSAGIVREDFGGSQVDVLADIKKAARARIEKAAETGETLPVNMGEEKLVSGPSGTIVKQKGRKVTSDEAKALVAKGASGSTKVSTASRRKDIMATPQGEMNLAKIQQQVLDNYNQLYAEEKKRIDELYDQRQAEIDEQMNAGTLSVGEAFDQGIIVEEERKRAKANAKAKLAGELPAAQAKAVEEFKVGKQTTQVTERKTEQQKAADTETKNAMAQVAKEVKAKYEKLFAEEKASLKEFYDKRIQQVTDEGGDVAAVIAEYQAAVADAKQSLEVAGKAERDKAVAAVPAQLQEQKMAKVESAREEKARAEDPFYDVKQNLATSGPVPGMPVVNAKMAQEQKAYTEYKAEKAGMSVSGYKYDLAKRVGKSAFDVRREAEFSKTETKNLAVGKARELKGVNVKDALKADTQEGRRVQGIIDQFAANLQKVDPSLGAEQARDAAIKLAEGLSEGKQSVEEIIATNKELDATFKKTLSETEIMNEAFRRTGQEIGESAEFVKANVSQKAIQQQEFISSKEGQRFGALAEFAPGMLQKFSKTAGGRALGAGADFISGKGGKLSKAFAGAGGFTGIGTGLAVGAEGLKQLLPKSMTSDPNTAGALGALGGAGTGAAMGAQIGSFAGPIGTLIGGVGGAIIGGIQGFFSAKNQAILTNALEKTAVASGNVTEAFKKLESEASQENFAKAQEAAGQLLDAGTDIESLAFAKTGFENLGSTFTGGVDKVSQGFQEGDVSKIVLGGLQTAFGAGGGGLLVDYFSAPSEAQRTEAIGAMVGGAGQRNEALANLATFKMKNTSTEELGKIFDAIKNGTGELNPIVQQYQESAIAAAEAANGTAQLTATQKESIKAQAADRAAMDAFMKKRKEAGATDEQIAKEMQKDPAAAKKEGQAALDAQAQLIAKQEMLARATKEVAVATENLLDVYRRIDAYAQRYSSELDQFGADVDAMIAGLGGDTSMKPVNRQNEQVLTNVSAYSMDEVRAAAGATAGLLGGTPEAQNLANQAVAQKVITDQIPSLLRNAKTPEARDQAMAQIRSMLEEQGLGGAAIETVLTDLGNKITEGVESGTGTSESDLQDVVQKSFATVGKGAEALANLAKKYNDTLQKATELQEKYNRAILEANSYMRKATQVRLNAELDLAKALGRSPTLQELNKPFDVEVQSLTSGLVGQGALAAGQASDPMAIADAITQAEKRKKELQDAGPELVAAAAKLPPGQAGDAQREALNQQQLANIQAMGELTVASNEGRQALEKLANDGTKAANALAKIQEEQQALEGFASFAQSVFTAEPQQLAQMEIQATALDAALSGADPDFMNSRFNRQQAYAGLEQEKAFMLPQEYRDAQAKLLEESYKAQGIKGTDVVKKIGDKEFTLDQLVERVRGGVDETDPNVIAFREASEVQAKANEALGKLNLEQAFIIQDAMIGLEDFFTNEFPNILAQATTDARRDSEPKPETKPEERKPTATESQLAEAKKEREARKDEEKKAKADAKKAEENVMGWTPGAGRAMEARAARGRAEEATARRKAADARVTDLEARAKAEGETRAAQEAEEARAKAARDAEEKARREREGAAQVDATLQRQGERVPRRTRPLQQPQGTPAERAAARVASTPGLPGSTPQTYGGYQQPQAQAQAQVAATPTPQVDEFTRKRLEEEKRGITEGLTQQELVKAEKEKELKKKRNMLKVVRIAALGAGTLNNEEGEVVNPRVLAAQEAVAQAEANLASINEQMSEQQRRAQEINQTLAGQPKPTTTTDASLMTSDERRAAGIAAPPSMSPQAQATANAMAAPVPSATYTNPVTGNTLTGAAGGTLAMAENISGAAQLPQDQIASAMIAANTGLIDSFGMLVSLASGEPGLMVHDAKVLEAINYLQEPLSMMEIAAKNSLEGMAAEKIQPSAAQLALDPTGVTWGADIRRRREDFVSSQTNAATQNAGRRTVGPVELPPPSPVPVTVPRPPSSAQPIATQAQTITVSAESLEGLTTFNTNFNSYVDKLINFQFPTIPDKIDVVLTGGNHTVDVRITGAAALEQLNKDMQKTAIAIMQPELQKLRDEISAKTGGAVKPSAALGNRPTG